MPDEIGDAAGLAGQALDTHIAAAAVCLVIALLVVVLVTLLGAAPPADRPPY